MAIEKVVYYYDDGTKKEYPPRLSALEQLEEFKTSKADIADLYEFLQEHLSRFEKNLSICFSHMVNELGMSDIEANELLDAWCDEWAVNNLHIVLTGYCVQCGNASDKVFCSDECYETYLEEARKNE